MMDAWFLGRAIILWCAIIPLAILNGVLREGVLARTLRPNSARTLSGVILSVLILLFSIGAIAWFPASRCAHYWLVGLLWFVLTIVFEFCFGRFVAKKSHSELLRAYRFEKGDIWPLVLGVVLIAPVVAAWIRSLC